MRSRRRLVSTSIGRITYEAIAAVWPTSIGVDGDVTN
jgi:hypothetical protein